MNRVFSFLFGSFFFCLFFSQAFAFEAEDGVSYTVSYYLDSTNKMPLQEVLDAHRADFKSIQDPNSINFGHEDIRSWILIQLNERNGTSHILTVENAHLDSVVLYKFYKGVIASTTYTGDHYPFFSREHDYNLFSFTLPDSCSEYLLEVRSEGSMDIPLSVHSIDTYIYKSNSNVFLLAIYYGVLLLAIVLNVLLFIRVKERIYFYYLLCLIGNGVVNSIDTGFFFQNIWPNYPALNHYAIVFYSFSVFSLIFSQKILSLNTNSKVLNVIFYFFIGMMGVLVISGLLGHYRIAMMYAVYYFYATLLLYLFSGWYVYFVIKYKPAFYYMLAWTFYSTLGIIYILAVEGAIPYNFYTKNALIIGNISEIILLFMAVIDKIYEFREGKEKSDKETIRLVEENRQILFEQNVKLEYMVRVRTLELEEINCEVQAQNEELHASREQLEYQNEVINNQNELLSKKKKVLQRLVKKRTLDLEKINTKLLHKNNTLEKFGYFTAHNIRGPVSSMLGLVNLFRLVKNNQEESFKIVTFLEQSALKLDEVVRDMITLLDLNNSEGIEREVMPVSIAFDESKEVLFSSTKEDENVVLVEDFKNYLVYADEVILKFIFDQLLENSLKFRSPDRPLEIRIEEEEVEGMICVSFSDNGMGFDFEKYEKDVFGLYKRFHHSFISGKGLGLYFVKEYIERLKGKISLYSIKGKGTTVKLFFEKVEA